MNVCVTCPYRDICIARYIDEAISGCNIADYAENRISRDELAVEKTYTVKVPAM